jgi:PPOX class probable F420-dependent enzyme
MPRPPLSAAAKAVLAKVNSAVLASVRPDGMPHTAAVWYELVDDRILLNMDATRLRLRFIRENPKASITVLDRDDWSVHVTVGGNVILEDDVGLETIDRLAQRYIRRPYTDRDSPRVTAWLEPINWYLWDARAKVTGFDAIG